MAKLFKETSDREISSDNYHCLTLPKNHMSKHIVLPSLAPLPSYPRMTSDDEQCPDTLWEKNSNRNSNFVWKKICFYGKSFITDYLSIHTVLVSLHLGVLEAELVDQHFKEFLLIGLPKFLNITVELLIGLQRQGPCLLAVFLLSSNIFKKEIEIPQYRSGYRN